MCIPTSFVALAWLVLAALLATAGAGAAGPHDAFVDLCGAAACAVPAPSPWWAAPDPSINWLKLALVHAPRVLEAGSLGEVHFLCELQRLGWIVMEMEDVIVSTDVAADLQRALKGGLARADGGRWPNDGGSDRVVLLLDQPQTYHAYLWRDIASLPITVFQVGGQCGVAVASSSL